MTDGERKVFWRGVAAGTLTGFAWGLIAALFVVMRPDLFAWMAL